MKRQLLSLLLLLPLAVRAADVSAGALAKVENHIELYSTRAPMGEQLFHSNDKYLVQRIQPSPDGFGGHVVVTHEVQPCFVDKSLRLLLRQGSGARAMATLKAMQENGYINISRLGDGEYKLDYMPRGKGGSMDAMAANGAWGGALGVFVGYVGTWILHAFVKEAAGAVVQKATGSEVAGSVVASAIDNTGTASGSIHRLAMANATALGISWAAKLPF